PLGALFLRATAAGADRAVLQDAGPQSSRSEVLPRPDPLVPPRGELVGAEREERGDAPEAREDADRAVGEGRAASAVLAPCGPIGPLESARAACASRLRRRRRRVRPQGGEPAALEGRCWSTRRFGFPFCAATRRPRSTCCSRRLSGRSLSGWLHPSCNRYTR